MHVLENKRFLNGLLLGAVLSASTLAIFVTLGFGGGIEPQSRENKLKESVVYAQSNSESLSVDWEPYQANLGKPVYLNGKPYLIVQELKNTHSGDIARILAASNDENKDYIELTLESGSIYELQCFNGRLWFGNRGENYGGETILTIWDKDGERLVGFNDIVMREMNTYAGCVRARKWFGNTLIFELADFRHAQVQVHYYGYNAETGVLDFLYAHESYATNQDRLAVWYDLTRQYAFMQFVGDDLISDLYRVPYIEIESVVEIRERLYAYPVALEADQAIQINLLEDERLFVAERGLIVKLGEGKSFVGWSP